MKRNLIFGKSLLRKLIQTLMRIGKSSGLLYIGMKTKGKKKNISSLKSDTGMYITSTRGKLEMLQKHYQLLSKMSECG